MNTSSLVIIVAYSIILFYFIKDTEYTKMLGLTLLTALLICQTKNNVEGYKSSGGSTCHHNIEGYKNSSGTCHHNIEGYENQVIDQNTPREQTPGSTFIKQREPTVSQLDVQYKIGPYDGLCVRTLNKQFKDLSENKLVSDDKLMTYLGVQGPVQNRISDNSVLTGPTVDGDPNSSQRLFMFANNESSLNCCPSTFSTDKGCVCVTPKQKEFVNTRGFNKSGKGQF